MTRAALDSIHIQDLLKLMKDANRETRLKAALRENLKRRKQQMRNRSASHASLEEQKKPEQTIAQKTAPDME